MVWDFVMALKYKKKYIYISHAIYVLVLQQPHTFHTYIGIKWKNFTTQTQNDHFCQ